MLSDYPQLTLSALKQTYAEEIAGVRLSAAQVASSRKEFLEDGLYDAIPVQPEVIEKVTWRPGMIMFMVR